MKKSLILTICLSVVAIVVISLGITFGWFLNITSTNSIDTSTKGIVFSYVISDGTLDKEDAAVYDVKNVTFFDVDAEGEGMYFSSMACMLTLTYENVCETNISVELSYTPSNETTSAHVGGLITTNPIDETKTYSTVNDVLDINKAGDTPVAYMIPLVKPNEKVTIYLYLFGVQPDDTASNSFFDGTYGFKLVSKAIKEVQ